MKRTNILGKSLFCLLFAGGQLAAQSTFASVSVSCNNPPLARIGTPYSHQLTFTAQGAQNFGTPTQSWSITNVSPSTQGVSIGSNSGAISGTFSQLPVTFTARLSLNYQNGELVINNSATCTIDVEEVKPVVASVKPNTVTVCTPGATVQISGSNMIPGVLGAIGSRRGLDVFSLQTSGISGVGNQQSVTATLSSDLLRNPPFNDLQNAGIYLANPPRSPGAISDGFPFTLRATPTILDYVPKSFPVGVAAVMTVTGSNLIPGVTQLRWAPTGGVPAVLLPRSGGTSGQLLYDIPATLLTTIGATASITLVNQEDANPSNSTYTCVTAFSVSVSGGSLSLSNLAPATATACGPLFTLTASTVGLLAGGQLRWDGAALGNQIPDPAKQLIIADVSAAQIGTAARTASVTAANPASSTSTGTTFGPPSAAVNFQIVAAPVINAPDIDRAPRGSGDLTIRFTGSNLIANVTRILWINGNTRVLLPSTVANNQITVTINGAQLLTNAGTARLIAVNADAANPNGALPTTGGSCPVERTFTIDLPTITLTASSVTTVDAVSPNDVPVTLTGTGFVPGSVVLAGGSTNGVTTTKVTPGTPGTPGTIDAILSKNLFATPGTLNLTVQNPDGTTSGARQIAVPLPRTPAITLTTNPAQPSGPTDQPALILTQSNISSRPLEGTVSLTFQPNQQVKNLPAGALPVEALPAFAASSSQDLTFDVPTGTATAIPLGMNGRFSLPSIAGTVTARLTRLVIKDTSLSVMPATAPSVSVQVNVAGPSIVTPTGQAAVRFTNATTTGFTIELDGLATGRAIDSAVFDFRAAAGVKVDSALQITVPLTNDFNTFFQSAAGLRSGSAFRLRVPFNITDGDANNIQGVTVTLKSSVGGDSQAVSGNR